MKVEMHGSFGCQTKPVLVKIKPGKKEPLEAIVSEFLAICCFYSQAVRVSMGDPECKSFATVLVEKDEAMLTGIFSLDMQENVPFLISRPLKFVSVGECWEINNAALKAVREKQMAADLADADTVSVG